MEDKRRLAPLPCLAFIGSSTTSGLGIGVSLARVFEGLFDEPRDMRHQRRWFNCATNQFRLSPDRFGAKQVAVVRHRNPAIVVAVDFLFWFVYGPHSDRQRSLEHGLGLLATLSCLVAVGTIPALPPVAIEGLPQEQRVSSEELRSANERIRAWVADNDSWRILVPWSETADRHPTLRQRDGLHTTIFGLEALARALARALVSAKVAPRELFSDRIIWE